MLCQLSHQAVGVVQLRCQMSSEGASETAEFLEYGTDTSAVGENSP
jgi:hypothetical protein